MTGNDRNNNVPKDDILIKQAKAGDESAAELLIRRHYPSILRYCRWHCPNIETAEDRHPFHSYRIGHRSHR